MAASGMGTIADMEEDCPAAMKNIGKGNLHAMSNGTSKAKVHCYDKDGTS